MYILTQGGRGGGREGLRVMSCFAHVLVPPPTFYSRIFFLLRYFQLLWLAAVIPVLQHPIERDSITFCQHEPGVFYLCPWLLFVDKCKLQKHSRVKICKVFCVCYITRITPRTETAEFSYARSADTPLLWESCASITPWSTRLENSL